jgi:hypothetical protein
MRQKKILFIGGEEGFLETTGVGLGAIKSCFPQVNINTDDLIFN